MERQQILAIAFRVERVAVMIGVAAGIVEGVPPTEEAEQVEEKLVQFLGLEDGAVAKLVGGHAHEETPHRAVGKEGDEKADPVRLRPQEKGQGPREDKQGQVPADLEPALRIAALRKRAQPRAFDGAAIPIDAEGFTDVGQ